MWASGSDAANFSPAYLYGESRGEVFILCNFLLTIDQRSRIAYSHVSHEKITIKMATVGGGWGGGDESVPRSIHIRVFSGTSRMELAIIRGLGDDFSSGKGIHPPSGAICWSLSSDAMCLEGNVQKKSINI